VYASDEWPDDVYCGPGWDRSFADEDDDWVADNCEDVLWSG
jgi:hypothetical protein